MTDAELDELTEGENQLRRIWGLSDAPSTIEKLIAALREARALLLDAVNGELDHDAIVRFLGTAQRDV
jgi:hypothetical protein